MKKEVCRLYHFSDVELITTTMEKIACMKRDEAAFDPFGITPTLVTHLEKDVCAFSETIVKVERHDQVRVNSNKEDKAEELRIAITIVMYYVELKFGMNSAKYRKFGVEELSNQSDSELLVTGKRVARFGMGLFADLCINGLTVQMLEQITSLGQEFFELIVDLQEAVAERDLLQDERIEEGNAIFTTLLSYSKTGQAIWEATDAVKYNDYVVYNTQALVSPGLQ